MIRINVIVAFENLSDIEKLLECILLQEKNCSPIVCVDNSINNFQAIQHLCQYFASINKVKVYYLKNSTNEGSAKGFAQGMQKAYELGADWIWVHDQDGYPREGCLSSLMNSINKEKLLAPCVVGEDGHRIRTFSARVDKKDRWIPVEVSSNKTEADIAGTAGLFINKEIINKIGVYDFNHYFVGMEDFDYCMRAKRSGFKLKIVKEAQYFHPNKWHIEQWEINRKLKYFGECSKNETRIKGGDIYYSIIYSNHLFIPSLLYSLGKMSLKYILKKDVHFKKSLFSYLSGLNDRYKNNKKITVDISTLNWIVY